MAKKNEVAVVTVESKPLAVVPKQTAPEGVLNSDVIVPAVLLMQGLSDFVAERKAQQGDIVRSVPFEVLGGPEKPVRFIPLALSTGWRIEENINGKFKFRGNEPRNAANDGLPWEFEKNGTKWKRTKTINLFALLPADLEKEHAAEEAFKKDGTIPDLDATLLPVSISFRSTGFQAGKMVSTHFTKAASQAKFGVMPYHYELQLKCSVQSNDKGTFYVYEVERLKDSRVKPEFLDKVQGWAQILSSSTVHVAGEDIDVDDGAALNGQSAF